MYPHWKAATRCLLAGIVGTICVHVRIWPLLADSFFNAYPFWLFVMPSIVAVALLAHAYLNGRSRREDLQTSVGPKRPAGAREHAILAKPPFASEQPVDKGTVRMADRARAWP
jgi:hypothetical protein